MLVFAGKDSPGSESDGGDSRSDTGSVEIQPKKVTRSLWGEVLSARFKSQIIGNRVFKNRK